MEKHAKIGKLTWIALGVQERWEARLEEDSYLNIPKYTQLWKRSMPDANSNVLTENYMGSINLIK